MLLFLYTFCLIVLLMIVAKKNTNFSLNQIVLFAIIIRIFSLLLFLTSKSDDINTFLRDGQYLLDGSSKYDASYFPFVSYLGVLAVLLKSYIHPYIFLKIIFSIFDVLILYPIYYLSKKNLNSVLIYALNPISIIVTIIHGQMDAITLFFFLSGLVLFSEKKVLASILTLSFAIYTKPWPILFLIPLIKKSKNKLVFALLLIFPLTLTLIHGLFFPAKFTDIIEKVSNYRGIFGVWGLSKIILFLADYNLNPIIETIIRRFFLVGFVIFSYFRKDKNILNTILMTMLFLFVFSPTFGIQWFVWLAPFVIIIKPRFWRIFLAVVSVYLTFGFAWDTNQYFRDIMPLWNSVITRIGFFAWIFMSFMFFKNLEITSPKQ